jgi:hypothetical protein
METPLILMIIAAGSAVLTLIGVIFIHILPGPNKLRQDVTDRLTALEKKHAELELKVAAEHPLFLERLSQLGLKLEQNTSALERMGTEINVFIRNFNGRAPT